MMVYTCISSPSSADLDVCMSVPGPVPDVPYDWFTRAYVVGLQLTFCRLPPVSTAD